MEEKDYSKYISILKEELIPAEGCTEPIAVAYAGAVARKYLGAYPEWIEVCVSGNIVKNVMGVSIPHCKNMKGVIASAVVGVIGGNPERRLEVISDITEAQIEEAEKFIKEKKCTIRLLPGEESLHIIVRAGAGTDEASCEIVHKHTNISKIERNGEVLYTGQDREAEKASSEDRACLSVDGIIRFADTVRIDDIRELLEHQIACNMKIAKAGLTGRWGNAVGATLYQRGERARAYAAAASDARMSGCNLPVVIVSGSGNQGATASLPVVIYAKEHGCSRERMLRALALSNLITIHLKSGIGRLSAYCGAVSAAAGSGSAMTYLDGGTAEQIKMTIVNTIAVTSGMICDGAKPSCAAKIAASLASAELAHEQAMKNQQFEAGTGIVRSDVEETINVVGRIASNGMRETDKDILKIMTE